jgi:ABC-2 type transport system ATP-binding protein
LESEITVKDVHHTYDGKKYALSGVSFEVRKGEVFGLLGRNGAGKTTLIRILTTLTKPTRGEVRVLGMDPEKNGQAIRSRIGVVQQSQSYEFSSVERSLDLYGMLWGVPNEERKRRKKELIALFGLEEFRKKRPFDLSGGEVRRVQIAREFMHDMDILFLDEPTVGLDVMMRRSMLDDLKERVKQGLTIIFTTHNLEEADYLCDRVAVIDQGKILALDTVDNLKRFYRGKKTVEFTVAGEEANEFMKRLEVSLNNSEKLRRDEHGAGVVLTDDTRHTIALLIELSTNLRVQLEWLNVRTNTLEDVFLNYLRPAEVQSSEP